MRNVTINLEGLRYRRPFFGFYFGSALWLKAHPAISILMNNSRQGFAVKLRLCGRGGARPSPSQACQHQGGTTFVWSASVQV